jgi:hypothetical protein
VVKAPTARFFYISSDKRMENQIIKVVKAAQTTGSSWKPHEKSSGVGISLNSCFG